MTLEDILSGIRYETLCGCASVEVREITFDSRAAVKGSVFVAIEGTQADGHDFVGKAVENGLHGSGREKSACRYAIRGDLR